MTTCRDVWRDNADAVFVDVNINKLWTVSFVATIISFISQNSSEVEINKILLLNRS